jgi:hypothetical protein
MAWPELDWSHNVRDLDDEIEDPFHYDRFDKIVARVAFAALNELSVPVASLTVDEQGLTSADHEALRALDAVNHFRGLVVPPPTTPFEHRLRYSDRLAGLNAALPFSEAERHWFFGGDKAIGGRRGLRGVGDGNWGQVAWASEAELVSDGVLRRVQGRDLMQRWWFWRRELGAYADGAGLKQARSSLEGLIRLLAPELGLPESYTALSTSERES